MGNVGGLAGRPSLIQHEQGQGCVFVLGVQFQHRIETAALVLKLVCLGCQPKPGASHRVRPKC